jgi:hypothetical protein
MKFDQFCLRYKGKDSLLGDFATDWLRDPEHPKDITAKETLRAYLKSKRPRVEPDIIKIAIRLYDKYLVALRASGEKKL